MNSSLYQIISDRKNEGKVKWLARLCFKILLLKIASVEDVTKLGGSEFQIGITLTAKKVFMNVISGNWDGNSKWVTS